MVHVIEYHPPRSRNVPGVSPTSPSPPQEAKSTIPPYPKGLSESAECPGKVEMEIFGLHLPSRQEAKTSQAKNAVKH